MDRKYTIIIGQLSNLNKQAARMLAAYDKSPHYIKHPNFVNRLASLAATAKRLVGIIESAGIHTPPDVIDNLHYIDDILSRANINVSYGNRWESQFIGRPLR
jgi:DNA polymerase III delta prime subunit